jgi:hypothetical protein
MPAPKSILREGLIAGFIGAMAVAVWFLIVDIISVHAFYTPNMLGAGLISVLGGAPLPGTAANVVIYTVFHFVAFAAAGILLAWVVHRAETEPHVLVIFTLLFIIFELGSIGIIAMLAEVGLHSLAWYQIAAGNILAAVSMGWYLWHAHPALRAELVNAIEGEG